MPCLPSEVPAASAEPCRSRLCGNLSNPAQQSYAKVLIEHVEGMNASIVRDYSHDLRRTRVLSRRGYRCLAVGTTFFFFFFFWGGG
eukprot:SAG11_NODE_569_length_8458_cov_5.574231_1_plen_85_part_10